MGCGSSQLNAENASTETAAQPDDSDELETHYPLHVMKISDFMALEKLRPHNELKAEGLVFALDLADLQSGIAVNFVSHQWLGWREADPAGDHLRTM
jgi:hypothetical protein